MKTQVIDHIGERLAPSLVDELSVSNPERLFALVPNGSEVSDGFNAFSIKHLAQAVNYTSWWIEKTFGPASGLETVSYMGLNDIRYAVFVFACNKTGYTPLLPSIRNSDEAFLHLLSSTSCKKFVYTAERNDRVLQLSKMVPDLQTVPIPLVSEMLAGSTQNYAYKSTFEQEEHKTAVIFHSSGTTGLPKPISLTHGYMAVIDRSIMLPTPHGRVDTHWRNLDAGQLYLSTTPFFHLIGYWAILESLFHNSPFVLPPDKPLSPEMLVDVMEKTRPAAAMLPPSIIEDMCSSDRALGAISRLKQLHYGGAPLSIEVGDKICKLTNLLLMIGTTEAGHLPTMVPQNKEDWSYYEWNPNVGIEMRPVEQGMFELVIVRLPNINFQGIFHTFPELREYHTKDTFTLDPTNPNRWKYYGRLDDVIVLSSGEKFNPVTIEKTIESHPFIHLAVVAGRDRFQASLLVEPNWSRWDASSKDDVFIEHIWPIVQQANASTYGHAHILKSKILLASKDKPFRTTPKGSSQRNHIYQDYSDEIDAIYARDVHEELVASLPQDPNIDQVMTFVISVVHSILERPLDISEDLYSAGLDSLQTILLKRRLQSGISQEIDSHSDTSITTQQIYSNSTIEKLCHLIFNKVHGGTVGAVVSISHGETLKALVDKYTTDIPKCDMEPSMQAHHTIILTGSTGSLGSYLLHKLLEDPTTKRVYCLNRSHNGASKQRASFLEKGLDWNSEKEGKIEFLQAFYGKENFGLEEIKYDEIVRSVDTIIHNAWSVDFNRSVLSFEDVHIAGVKRFVDFSLQSTHKAHIYFTSSVATIGAWNNTQGPTIPEKVIENPNVVLQQGYGESKYVGERICLEASRSAGVPTTVLRLGQIAGPTTRQGAWNKQEWLPTIISTSKAVGEIPNGLGNIKVDWIPVDTLAAIITEIVRNRRNNQAQKRCATFNLVNPQSTPWKQLLPVIRKHIPATPVSLKTWVTNLESIKNPSAAEVESKPALKLLDTYRNFLYDDSKTSSPMEQQEAKLASDTLRSLRAIDSQLMENWMKQWNL